MPVVWSVEWCWCAVVGGRGVCVCLVCSVCVVRHDDKIRLWIPTRLRVCSQNVPVCIGNKSTYINTRALCRYIRGRFQCTHGGLWESTYGGGRGGGHRLFRLPGMTHVRRVITCPRGSPEVTTGFYPCFNLRISREQHVPDSSNHSLHLMKLLSSSYPEGKLRKESAVRWFGLFSAPNPSLTNALHGSIATSLHQVLS